MCEVKKTSLIVFIVAFGLSIVFTLLPLAARASFSVALQGDIAESLSINSLLGVFFGLIGLAVFFVVFYFLANNNKLTAVKSTIIALFLGVILGPIVLSLLDMFLFSHYSVIYIILAANFSSTSVFHFFLPALTSLLYVELREKRNKQKT